jgi:hypothetical protein
VTAYAKGRAEALEEAASYCETDGLVRTAAAIRALKDKLANQTDGGE